MTLLIIIIYLGFVALGLPDSLFGTAWPVLQPQLDVPLSYAGFVTMTISGGTIIASLLSDRLTFRFGAAKVTAFSIMATALALFGFSRCTALWMLVLCAIPLGLGAGAVDAALNNFVALHFSSKHMSWLHCFWGVGASISPYIMGFWLSRGLRWDLGYVSVSAVLALVTAIMFASLPVWKKAEKAEREEIIRTAPKKAKEIAALPGIFYVLFAFFAYCSIEGIAFVWTSTYLVNNRGMAEENAARFASLFYLGMTLSRFLTGFVADRFGDRKMIKWGYFVCFAGILMILLPVKSPLLCLAGLVIAGFGCGPVYPAVIHSTPDVFGRENSQAVIGVQMASAYCGTTFMPPVFGIFANHIGLHLFPFFLLGFALTGLTLTELLFRKKADK
ncbi:MAG: MFS transporter [Clostridia bacterium]|nr:MFS transporter [Clostridia bacterium]